MKKIKSLKTQLALQFAIIILPMMAILIYQTVSDIQHSERLARSYHYLCACGGVKLKYTQFINGAVDAVDTGRLGAGAFGALEEAAARLGNLAREDHSRDFAKLQEKMDHLLAALRHDRAMTILMPLRKHINQADAELANEYLHYEKANRQAIEENITFAKTQRKIGSAAIFVTLLLSMMVGRLMTRTIIRPITESVAFAQSVIQDSVTELAHGATRPAEKGSASRERVKATGEVQLLVDSIYRMAEDLGKRTSELLDAQEELVRKEKLSILGQLSGSVGHELRNPLGVMSNAVYFLKMVLADADATTKEYLEIIRYEIDNSQRIITDLLDFARTRTPQAMAVTACELIEQTLGRCAVPENVELRTEMADSLPPLHVDPLQIGQVLQNLITNAVQAMPEGGCMRIGARKVRGARNEERGREEKDLEPRTSNLEPDGDFIEISVADTGVGISPDGMKRLFQPLFTTKSKGIGLGLVVCRNLTEANGGRIGVESRPGEGTTFTVILPVGKERELEGFTAEGI